MNASGSASDSSLKPTKDKQRICYLSAAPEIYLHALLSLFEETDIEPVLTSTLLATTTSLEESIQAISQADLFLALLSSTEDNVQVYFELGIALASHVRTLLITPKGMQLPPNIAQIPLVSTEPDNREAITFALEQILSAPTPVHISSGALPRPSQHPIGDVADTLLEQLLALGEKVKEAEIIDLVSAALRAGGVSIVVQSPLLGESPKGQADLAVWSDDFNSFIGNPLLLEIRVFQHRPIPINKLAEQVAAYLLPRRTRSALILYLGEPSNVRVPSHLFDTVFAMDVREFFRKLKTKSFAQILIEMRNRRVHGIEA